MTFDIARALANLPASMVVGIIGVIALLLLGLPLALRAAGLTGQQIADTISLTLQFFVNIVHELRAQNKDE